MFRNSIEGARECACVFCAILNAAHTIFELHALMDNYKFMDAANKNFSIAEAAAATTAVSRHWTKATLTATATASVYGLL